MNNTDNGSSRYDKRSKRKKTNIILNGLIGVVILLIIVVGTIIFSGGKDEDQPADSAANEEVNNEETSKENSSDEKDDATNEGSQEGNSEEEENNDNEENKDEESNEEENNEEKVKEEEIVTEGGSSADVNRTVENPAWQPVGTVQDDHPTAVYDQSHVDWDEMLRAITYATGLDRSAMTVYFLGNDGVNRSVGTVASPNKDEMYRVYIEWVDGKGWKPTKVEELNSI
ncbi:DUF1510 family protein [Cytobacillus kochii]|uniref:DUF1510 family protein n=1 Tax=Cytobacillus TaxID=2675230 RepID=UPI002786B11E|nr:DUF1510 family protein [Cytobacillus kochii]MDQ0183631.1 cytoskeletal protein RodZ [Cytobacillus kochii]